MCHWGSVLLLIRAQRLIRCFQFPHKNVIKSDLLLIGVRYPCARLNSNFLTFISKLPFLLWSCACHVTSVLFVLAAITDPRQGYDFGKAKSFNYDYSYWSQTNVSENILVFILGVRFTYVFLEIKDFIYKIYLFCDGQLFLRENIYLLHNIILLQTF